MSEVTGALFGDREAVEGVLDIWLSGGQAQVGGAGKYQMAWMDRANQTTVVGYLHPVRMSPRNCHTSTLLRDAMREAETFYTEQIYTAHRDPEMLSPNLPQTEPHGYTCFVCVVNVRIFQVTRASSEAKAEVHRDQ
jgi:hypothetical protein